MNMRTRIVFLCLLLGALLLSGCGLRSQKAAAPKESPSEEIIIEQTEPLPSAVPEDAAPAATPLLTETPAPVQTAAPAPMVTPAPTEPTPLPAATPQPTLPPAGSGLPTVTKSPTGEKVAPGGSCWFVAKYEDAIWAEWHFVSPDGSRDLDYAQAAKEFPGLEILKGYASTMQLKNIPESLNGWSVYCRFSNHAGAVKTAKASITVEGSKTGGSTASGSTASGSTADGRPIITKNPTGETIGPGGSCTFVAKYKDAIWAEWHFVSPDGSRDLDYAQAANAFPGMSISGGDSSVLKLSAVPSSFNGWSVYCRFSNHVGAVKTTKAYITVTGSGTVVSPDNPGTVTPGGPGTVTPDWPGTVVPGGSDPTEPIGPWNDYPVSPGSDAPSSPGSDYPGSTGSDYPGGPGSDYPGGPGVVIYG